MSVELLSGVNELMTIYYPTFNSPAENCLGYSLLITECFDGIDRADVVVAITKDYHLGIGVLYELSYAYNSASSRKRIIIANVSGSIMEAVDVDDYKTFIQYYPYNYSSPLSIFNFKEQKESGLEKQKSTIKKVEKKIKDILYPIYG